MHSIEGSVGGTTYTIYRSGERGRPAARLIIFPGLLGTEFTYAQTAVHIAQTRPIEVVTMTHGRSLRRLPAPMEARQRSCLAVLGQVMSRTSLPNYIVGHSLGGADALRLATGPQKHLVDGVGLEASVGLSEVRPRILSVADALHKYAKDLPREYMKDAIVYAGRNPALAAAEAVHARQTSLVDMHGVVESPVLYEAYNQHDVLIRPPTGRSGAYVRSDGDHMAICLNPEVGAEFADRFLEHRETRQVA